MPPAFPPPPSGALNRTGRGAPRPPCQPSTPHASAAMAGGPGQPGRPSNATECATVSPKSHAYGAPRRRRSTRALGTKRADELRRPQPFFPSPHARRFAGSSRRRRPNLPVGKSMRPCGPGGTVWQCGLPWAANTAQPAATGKSDNRLLFARIALQSVLAGAATRKSRSARGRSPKEKSP